MTIKDLAERTGYGVATVSRVLNGHPNVSEKARKAILEAVEESGFQINTNAKQLKAHATSILVIDLEAGLLHRFQNRFAGFLADIGLVIQHPGYGGNAVACFFRQVLDRHGLPSFLPAMETISPKYNPIPE